MKIVLTIKEDEFGDLNSELIAEDIQIICMQNLRIMKKKLKNVRCDNCKYFNQPDKNKYDGWCTKDDTYTAEHRVCNKLPTDEDRRNAKLRRNG